MQRLSRQDAQNLLRHCLEYGVVIPGKHFLQELTKEAVDVQDAWEVLSDGRIYNEPEFHTGKQE